jgi:magnesium transporter
MSDTRQILADPVTRHMRTDPTRIQAGSSVAQALDYIRDHEIGGRVVYFYVVDDENRLAGVVPTRRLLRAKPGTPVADVMVSPVVAVPHTATVLAACEFVALHKLLAFPVVDADRKAAADMVTLLLYFNPGRWPLL